MPNTLSYLVLFSWPLVVFILFSQLPRAQALCLSVLIGAVLLVAISRIPPNLLRAWTAIEAGAQAAR